MSEPSGTEAGTFRTASGVPVERVYTPEHLAGSHPLPDPGAPESFTEGEPISVSGYEYREGGATAMQELAFTLAGAIRAVEIALRGGATIADVAPRLCLAFSVQGDLFEEIAKFRAARRLWAHLARERFSAPAGRCEQVRILARVSASFLAHEQDGENVIRTALAALAAALGGAELVDAPSSGEPPDAEAAVLAVRARQVVAHESGVAAESDPLGGSYYLEYLTNELERRALDEIRRIDEGVERGGSA